MHTFIACAVTGIVCFGAGSIYDHTMATLAHKDAKLALDSAANELRKVRGEITNFVQQHLPRL